MRQVLCVNQQYIEWYTDRCIHCVIDRITHDPTEKADRDDYDTVDTATPLGLRGPERLRHVLARHEPNSEQGGFRDIVLVAEFISPKKFTLSVL